MDLGIAGRKAIVCASSRGLGKACAIALADAGVSLVLNGRDEEALTATANEIVKATGVSVTPVLADISTQDGQAKVLDACPSPDILINNNGGGITQEAGGLDQGSTARGDTVEVLRGII